MSDKRPGPCGVLVVDKPVGPTSHDVVSRVRRALGERRVGHAGTLDPLASGVLVVLVGEATKLSPYLTADDKSYRARVAFGAATDTLDAEGTILARGDVPAGLLAELRALANGGVAGELVAEALAHERARTEQIPPAFSALKRDGIPSHERARAGLPVELAPRAVEVRTLEALGADLDAATLDLEMSVGKGYYVRSLARDLGERLGVPAHLAALRRTSSGAFTLAAAVDLANVASASLVSITAAATRALGSVRLTEAGTVLARGGRPLAASDFETPPPAGLTAWLSSDDELVAIGKLEGEAFRVVRGFPSTRAGV